MDRTGLLFLISSGELAARQEGDQVVVRYRICFDELALFSGAVWALIVALSLGRDIVGMTIIWLCVFGVLAAVAAGRFHGLVVRRARAASGF